jgi:hypothetical protein
MLLEFANRILTKWATIEERDYIQEGIKQQEILDARERHYLELVAREQRNQELQGMEQRYQELQEILEHTRNLQNSQQQINNQYEIRLREAFEERNQLHEINQELEQRYQELYHTFLEAVEEEAGKLVTEAAQTMVHSPKYTPPILRDVVKTLEFQVKQTEDQHVAELMALMRQAQRKNEILEMELAREREKIAAERRNLLNQQNSENKQE